MTRLSLHQLGDSVRFSLVLNEALNQLRESHLRFTANHLCRITELDAADLSRMRRLHLHLKYEKLVSRYKLWRLIQYLLEQFPTLAILKNHKGEICVRLYKEYRGRRLMKSLHHMTPPKVSFRPHKKKK